PHGGRGGQSWGGARSIPPRASNRSRAAACPQASSPCNGCPPGGDLIEYIAENACEAPILLLCLARHELLDQRPRWGGGKLNAASVSLEPLTGAESETLADWLIRDLGAGEATCARGVETARGDPLFTDQLAASLADGQGDTGEPPLPGTIEALLAARLDLPGPAERVTLENAAALGDRFPAVPLARLVPPDLISAAPRAPGRSLPRVPAAPARQPRH